MYGFMMFHSTLIIFLMLKVVQGSDPETCSALNPIEVCEFNPKRNFPSTDEELYFFCDHYLAYYYCVEKKADILPKPDELCGLALVLKNAEEVVREACLSGTPFRKAWEENGPCIAIVQKTFFKVFWESALIMAEEYEKEAKDPKRAKSLKYCMSGVYFLEEARKTIMNMCPKSLLFYSQIVQISEMRKIFCRSDQQYQEALQEGFRYYNTFVKTYSDKIHHHPGVVVTIYDPDLVPTLLM